MPNTVHVPSRLAIIGGGQLGMMLHQSAHALGIEVAVLDSSGVSAHQVGAKLVEGKINDPAAVRRLADTWGKDVPLTIEVEHVAIDELKKLHKEGFQVHPNPDTMTIIADKLIQKKHLAQNGIPVAEFEEVRDAADIKALLADWQGGLIIKTRKGGFDGRGNVVIGNAKDIYSEKAQRLIAGGGIYVEKKVPFEIELAVILVRDVFNNVVTYPVVETIHENNICKMVISPARIDVKTSKVAESIGVRVLDSLYGAGVFAVEMFLLPEGKVLVNEIAPRVHNSGHLTIEANKTSQFENHIRAVTGRELKSTDRVSPHAVMINILEGVGKHKPDIIKIGPQAYLHWYGKEGRMAPLEPRKIGHVTGLGSTHANAMIAARAAYDQAMEGVI